MPIPKSKKLAKEEDSGPIELKAPSVFTENEPRAKGPIQIREVQCFNDFVAILLLSYDTSIAVPEQFRYKNEGIVVGVGPGVADGAGGRLTPQANIGDVVMFGEKNVINILESDSPPYVGSRVVIVSERNVICKLPREIDWVPYAEI